MVTSSFSPSGRYFGSPRDGGYDLAVLIPQIKNTNYIMKTSAPNGESSVETNLTGVDLINRPTLNKGTAFAEEERDHFRLYGLLPFKPNLRPNPGRLHEY